MENGCELSQAADNTGAVVICNGATFDASKATGRYVATLIGPMEHLREQYCKLRDQALALIDSGQEAAAAVIHAVMEPMTEMKWVDCIENKIVDAGKVLALNTILAGSAFTATVVMGLTGATPTVADLDTQGTHAGWLEVGLANAPAYTAPRKTPSWNTASGTVTVTKSTSAAVSFGFTSGGTVGGCFININGTSGIDNATGTLFSAGAFTGGNKTVQNGDTLNVTYQASLT
jgi:hypothetical protein